MKTGITLKSREEGNFWYGETVPYVDPVYEGTCFSIPMNDNKLLRLFMRWCAYSRNYEEISPFPLHKGEPLVICNTYSSVGEFIDNILADTRKNHVRLSNYERFLFASPDRSFFLTDLDENMKGRRIERYPDFNLNEFHDVLEQLKEIMPTAIRRPHRPSIFGDNRL